MTIYRRLIAWQKAMDLAVAVGDVTDRYPQSQTFALTIQTQKAANSIPSNIAEGRGRGTRAQFCYFLKVARGSAYELGSHLTYAMRRRFIDAETEAKLISDGEEVIRLINGLLRKYDS